MWERCIPSGVGTKSAKYILWQMAYFYGKYEILGASLNEACMGDPNAWIPCFSLGFDSRERWTLLTTKLNILEISGVAIHR